MLLTANSDNGDDVRESIEGSATVHLEGPAADGVNYCGACGEQVAEYSDGWEGHAEGCEYAGQPPRGVESWLNSAGIIIDNEDDSADVRLSVGDPRGAFVMTVRRHHDGDLVLYVPSDTDGTPHMGMQRIRAGAYRLGHYSADTLTEANERERRADAAEELIVAVRRCLLDLERHASTHGPGPDRRLEALRRALTAAGADPSPVYED